MEIIDITRKRGDTYPVKLVITEDGSPVGDITGYTGILSVTNTKEPEDPDYVFQSIGEIADAANSKMWFPISIDDANHVGDFYYDIQITDASGYKHTVLEGKYKLKQDRTKD